MSSTRALLGGLREFVFQTDTTGDTVSGTGFVTVTGGRVVVAVPPGAIVDVTGWISYSGPSAGDINTFRVLRTNPDGTEESAPTVSNEVNSASERQEVSVPQFALGNTQAGKYTFDLQWNRSAGSGTATKITSSLIVRVYEIPGDAKRFLSTAQPRPMGRGQNVLEDRGPFAPSP